MPSLMAMLGLDASRFHSSLNKSVQESALAGKKIASSLGDVVTEKLAEFASVGAIEETIRKTIEWGEQVSILSQRLGISTDAVQAWDYALRLNGSSIQGATGFLEKLAVARQKALTGDEKAIASFHRLGVSIDELKNKRLEDIGLSISEAFQSGDPQKLIADLREVGGKSAGEMVAAFREGFADIIKEAKDSGVVIDESTIGKLRDSADELKTLGSEIMTALAPAVAWLSDSLTFIWRTLQRAGVGLVTLPLFGKKAAKEEGDELEAMWKEQDRRAAERSAKRSRGGFPGAALEESESKEKPSGERRAAEETQRLEEQLAEIRDKNALEAMSKEEQINELYRRRAVLAQFVAQNWKQLTVQGRLKAQIDLERLNEELMQKGKERDKKDSTHTRSIRPDINSLQSVGAYAPAGAGVDLQRQSEAHLRSISRGIQQLVDRRTPGSRGVKH